MEANLPIYQLGLPDYLGMASLGAGKVQIVPTKDVRIKPINMTPTTGAINPNRRATSTRELSYYERTGQRRFDVIAEHAGVGLNLLGQGVSLAQQLGILKQPQSVVYVQDRETGEKRQLSENEKIEYAQNLEKGGTSSGNNWMEQYIQYQMLKDMNNDKGNNKNLPLYLGLGVGSLFLVTLLIVMSSKK